MPTSQLHPRTQEKMVILFKLATLLLAVLIVLAFSSIFANQVVGHGSGDVIQARTKMELVGSSNFTDAKTHAKRQSGYKTNKKSTLPPRDSKLYLEDGADRDIYSEDEYRQYKPVHDDEQNYSSTVPIYRSNQHYAHYYGFPGTGYGFGGMGGNNHGGGGGGSSMSSGFGPLLGFGSGVGNSVFGGGHAVGHTISVLDPLFLMITLSFILFLVNSILGIVDRIKLPVIRARSDDIPLQSDLGLEIIDSLIFEIRDALDKYSRYEHKRDQQLKPQ